MRPVNLLIVERDGNCRQKIASFFHKKYFQVEALDHLPDYFDEVTDAVIIGGGTCRHNLKEQIDRVRLLRPNSAVLVAVEYCDPEYCTIWDKPSYKGCPLIKAGADAVILTDKSTAETAVKDVMVSIARNHSAYEDMTEDLRNLNMRLSDLAFAG